MIEHTWKWAAAKGKIYKHAVNQAEYIDIDVDQCRERQTKRTSELQASSAFTMEDQQLHHIVSMQENIYYTGFVLKLPHCPCQDTTGSILDSVSMPGRGAAETADATPACAVATMSMPCLVLKISIVTNNQQLNCLALNVYILQNFARKGPVERVAFPASNANVSPYQQIAQYIMILGQKIDSARDLKAGKPA